MVVHCNLEQSSIIEHGHFFADLHILVVLGYFSNGHSARAQLNFKRPPLSKFLERRSADVRDDVSVIVNVNHMADQRVLFVTQTARLGFFESSRRASYKVLLSSTRQVGRGRNKDFPLRKGGRGHVQIQPRKIEYAFGLFV